jgi:hypothetical protein
MENASCDARRPNALRIKVRVAFWLATILSSARAHGARDDPPSPSPESALINQGRATLQEMEIGSRDQSPQATESKSPR